MQTKFLFFTVASEKNSAVYAQWPDEIRNWKYSTLSGSNVPFSPLDPRGSPFVEDTLPDLKDLPGNYFKRNASLMDSLQFYDVEVNIS